MFGLVKNENTLHEILKLIADPEILASDFGMRSLSKQD
jgi:hypothetical protein